MNDRVRVLVTGGAGFIGSHLVRHLIREEGCAVTNIDLLTYAGNPENLADIESEQGYRFVRGDVSDREAVRKALEGVGAVFHLAAESHVDRSIEDSEAFVRTNVLGTRTVLDEAHARRTRVVVVSTDEVYGSLETEGEAPFTEAHPIAPNSPYAASKAAGDLLARAWHRTYGADVVITRCSNNYGPNQFPEKFLPLMILRAMAGEPMPIYGDGLYRRDWLHVSDHCRGLVSAWRAGRAGRVYNFGTAGDQPNLEVARSVARIVREETGAAEAALVEVPDRPGHDRRYSVDASRARAELDWQPRVDLYEGLRQTVRWYRDNREWWERIVSGDYLVDRRSAERDPAGN
jgi:dTDP-glucose 4,6-dehydratase